MVSRKELKDRVGECKDMISAHKEQTEEDYKIYSVLCGIQDILTPVSAEIEGGGNTWFFVCGECHGAIDGKDKFCRYCGCAVCWDE